MPEGINPNGGDMYTDAMKHERGEYISGHLEGQDDDEDIQNRARNLGDFQGDVSHEAVDPNGDPLDQLIAREEEEDN